MWITDIESLGFRGIDETRLKELDRTVSLDGPGPALEQLAMALELFFAAFDPEDLRRVLTQLGFVREAQEVEIVGQPLPDHASWPAPHAARALLQPGDQRRLRIQLSLVLDPPQFRLLRRQALRDPSLVSALSEGATATIAVGYLFNQALTTLTVAPLSVRLGGEKIPVAGKDSPAWLPAFLRGLAGRLHVPCGRRGAQAWLDAALSPDPQRRAAHDAVLAALQAEPFQLDAPRPVRWQGETARVVLGAQGMPLDWAGATAQEALALVSAAHLSGAEILLLRHPGATREDPAPLLAWLDEQALGAGSPLEQVFMLGVRRPATRQLPPPPREPEPRTALWVEAAGPRPPREPEG